MNPETRRLIRVMPEDAQKTQEIFELLLGDNLDGRKDYINSISDMIEKPKPEEVISNFAILGRCVLPAKIFSPSLR